MTELTFTILKYGFLLLLWVFVWLAVRGLHKDVAAGLSRHGRHGHDREHPAQPQVLVGGSGPSLLDNAGTPADQAEAALGDQDNSAGPAVSDLATAPSAPSDQESPVPAPDGSPNMSSSNAAAQKAFEHPVEAGNASQNAQPASPESAKPERRPLSGTTSPVPVGERHDVLGSFSGLPSNPGQDNASESSDLASLVAGVANEKRERSKTALPVPTMLTIIDGPRAGSAVTLEGPAITIGRAGDNTVVLHDEYVSAHHCQLVPDGTGQWRLEDLGSTNGTYVNESRLRQPAIIPVGTPVRIGATTFTLR